MVAFHKGHELVHSVTTLNSPNRGSSLLNKINAAPHAFPLEKYERIFSLIGLSKTNAFEFISANMEGFNMHAPEHPNVDYFSVGSATGSWGVDDRLKFTHAILAGAEGTGESDGFMYWEDAVWGKSLL